MARDGSGTFSLAEAAFVDGTTIDSTAVNSDLSDIAAGLTQSLSKDGQTVPTANQPMGGFRHTGVGTATARTNYLRTDQYIDGGLVFAEDGGTADAYSITLSPGITAYTEGNSFFTKIAHANATTTPTFAVNGLTAGTITWPDGTALAAGDLPANACVGFFCAAVSTGTPTWHLFTMTKPLSAYLTTRGDIVRRGASAPQRVALGPSGAVLTSDGTDAKWGVLRSYLAGLGTKNNSGTPNTKIDVLAGVGADDTNVQAMTLAATTLDCGTTGANGLDSGSLANSTWYHLFVIAKTDGTTALLASTSISSPTYPSGYTLKRRIASFLTDGSAHIVGYIQNGDNFRWKTPVKDVDGVIPGVTTRTTKALTVPTGFIVFPDLVVWLTSSAAGVNFLITSLDETDTVPAVGLNQQLVNTVSTLSSGTSLTTLHTNTSAQIGYRVTATDASVGITTFGWRDTRGKDA